LMVKSYMIMYSDKW